MNKSKISMKPLLKFLRELAVVVTGIAVTVSIGFWVNSINVKKDQKQYLDAIILELKENAEKFDDYAKKLQKSVGYSNYLRSLTDEKSLSLDSVSYYGYCTNDEIGWGEADPVTLYNKNAFEMFKFSGDMRQLDDKELLLSIWKVYYLMESTQERIDGYIQCKKEMMMLEIQRLYKGEKLVARLYFFYMDNIPLYMKCDCEGTAEFIRETVSRLETSKMVK